MCSQLGRLTSLLLVMVSCRSASAQLLVEDSFDMDVASWAAPPEAGASIAWDRVGTPGGSLRLVTPPGTPPYVWARSACFTRDPETTYLVRGDTYREFGAFCFPSFVAYDGPDCSGELVALSVPRTAGDPQVWIPTESEIPTNWPGVSIELGLATNGEGVCLFDNVSLRGIPPVSEIPALGGLGASILAVLVALAAIGMMRRR